MGGARCSPQYEADRSVTFARKRSSASAQEIERICYSTGYNSITMPSAAALSPAIAKLKAEYQRLYGKPASGPQRNQAGWLKQKIADKQPVSASVHESPRSTHTPL